MWKPIYKVKDHWQVLEVSIRVDTVELLNNWCNLRIPKKHIIKEYVNEFKDLDLYF